MKISGIYKIESRLKPERSYIGSAINIDHRWNCHLSDLKKGIHHSKKLQRHFNKHTESDLQFSILVKCRKEDLINNEQIFIDLLKPYFNCSFTAGSQLGIKRSDEYKRKSSESRKGKKISDETKRKMSESHKGYKATEGTKLKIKNSWERRKLIPVSEETKKRMSESHKGKQNWLGRHHSDETIKKFSELRKGKKRGKYKKSI